MLTRSELASFVSIKCALHQSLQEYCLHHQRHLCEGLSDQLDCAGFRWSISPQGHQWHCHCPQLPGNWLINLQCPAEHFRPSELCCYLQGLEQHRNINPIVVDNWMILACQRGLITSCGRGQFTLCQQVKATPSGDQAAARSVPVATP